MNAPDSKQQGVHGNAGTAGETAVKVLIYSDDSTTREKVVLALGRRVAADLPPIKTHEFATPLAVVNAVDKGGFDVLILDGEATPAGGMGVCRQLKDEIYECPPVLVLTGRPQDGWLATWSRAEAWTPHPIDPVALADSVAELVRARLAKRVAA
jgi:DNA-binding response OmpR family regulator